MLSKPLLKLCEANRGFVLFGPKMRSIGPIKPLALKACFSRNIMVFMGLLMKLFSFIYY